MKTKKLPQNIEAYKKEKEFKDGSALVVVAIKDAANIKIRNPKELTIANDRVTVVARFVRMLDKKRKELKAPILTAGRGIDGFFGEHTAPAKKAEFILRRKIGDYLDRVEKVRLALQEKADADHEEETETAKNLGAAPPEKKAIAIAEAPKKIAGNTVRKKLADVSIVDFSKVPDEYKAVNLSAVRAAYKEGVREIAGLWLKEENDLTIR